MLYIVNKLCRFAATKLRLLVSAALGAMWSVISILVPKNMHWLIIICTYVLISFFMIKICANKCRFQEVLKGVIVLYGVTGVLSGLMHMFYYNTYLGYLVHQVILKDSDLLWFVVVSVVLLYLIIVQFIKIKSYGDKICKVHIEICNQCFDLRGFIDTGNVLVDPYSGKPVCVVCKTHFSSVLASIDCLQQCKYHMIPFSSLGCERGLLEVITVDNMYIYCGEKVIKVEQGLLGLSDTRLSTDEEFDMLINADIMNMPKDTA